MKGIAVETCMSCFCCLVLSHFGTFGLNSLFCVLYCVKVFSNLAWDWLLFLLQIIDWTCCLWLFVSSLCYVAVWFGGDGECGGRCHCQYFCFLFYMSVFAMGIIRNVVHSVMSSEVSETRLCVCVTHQTRCLYRPGWQTWLSSYCSERRTENDRKR